MNYADLLGQRPTSGLGIPGMAGGMGLGQGMPGQGMGLSQMPNIGQMLMDDNPYLAVLNQLLGDIQQFRKQYPRAGQPILDTGYGFGPMGGSNYQRGPAPSASQTMSYTGAMNG